MYHCAVTILWLVYVDGAHFVLHFVPAERFHGHVPGQRVGCPGIRPGSGEDPEQCGLDEEAL